MKKKFTLSLYLLITINTTQCTFDQCMQFNNDAYRAIQADRLTQALELYHSIITLDPSIGDAYYNCGYVLTRLNHNDQAIIAYKKALAINPKNSHARLGLGKALLACGNYTEGWHYLEDRFSDPGLMQRAFGYGSFDVTNCKGKKILLRSEWGLGDMVHFVRYAKLLHERGARVIVQAFDALVPLFSLCDYIESVISISDPIPANDIQIPMMSLPLLFGTTMQTIPAPIPYLKADAKLVKYWEQELKAGTRLKIGICWHAKPIYLEDHATTRRSIPLALFEPLTQLPVTLYSLQKEYGMDEQHTLKRMISFDNDFDLSHGRFMDTAALIMNMDLIISADTSIVHVAGALGKTVWVLLPYAAEWRWLPGVPGYEERTEWYPSMRLFRQKRPGDWREVVEDVAKELALL